MALFDKRRFCFLKNIQFVPLRRTHTCILDGKSPVKSLITFLFNCSHKTVSRNRIVEHLSSSTTNRQLSEEWTWWCISSCQKNASIQRLSTCHKKNFKKSLKSWFLKLATTSYVNQRSRPFVQYPSKHYESIHFISKLIILL